MYDTKIYKEASTNLSYEHSRFDHLVTIMQIDYIVLHKNPTP